MKLKSLFLIFAIVFSFANTEKKYVLLGFDNYIDIGTAQTCFTMYLKSYTNNYTILLPPFNLTSLINYQNRINNSEIQLSCSNTAVEEDSNHFQMFYCTINEHKDNITRVQLKNYNITNSTGHVIISEDEILMSSFALEQKDNIQKYDSNLDFLVFNL